MAIKAGRSACDWFERLDPDGGGSEDGGSERGGSERGGSERGGAARVGAQVEIDQSWGSQWLLGKSFDTVGPCGPALVAADEVPNAQRLDLDPTVNGVTMQRANTRSMIFAVPHLVAYLSQVMTLEPGDLISTGTPAKLPEAAEQERFLEPGDVVRSTIEGIGTLTNPVASSPPALARPAR